MHTVKHHVYFHYMYCIVMFTFLFIDMLSSKVAMPLFLTATSVFLQVCNVPMPCCMQHGIGTLQTWRKTDGAVKNSGIATLELNISMNRNVNMTMQYI